MNLWLVFDQVVERFPDRIAVEVQHRERVEATTYRALRAHARSWAAWLHQHGIAPGDRCAIYADNDAAWCAAYLGVLCAGGVAVPLDTNYTAAQVATIVQDAGARVVFVSMRLRASADAALEKLSGVRVADLHQIPAAALPVSAAGDAREDGDAAVILYTSGTTADPKGVVLTHANLIAERDAAFAIVAVDERDSVLGVLPLFHALAQLANLLLPFAVGARVVFLETLNSTELVRALAERRITIFACVPQFFYLIHQRITGEVQNGGALKSLVFNALLALSFRLRRLGINAGRVFFGRLHASLGAEMRLFITGGSKFDPAIGRDFYALGFTILQAYGLTETSGAATLTRPDEAHIDTVGGALPGQEVRILPPESDGLDGEIAIRGPVVMQGYFNRPDATAAVMRDGWLLTGDLGRLDGHGRLTITGRKKDVIVLSSGKNIYPEEIEANYLQSAYIKEICVMGLLRDDRPTTERLYAVVVPHRDRMREKKIVNAGDLIRFEMEGRAVHLPPHKRVLGYEVWFDDLPRTTTGKLKRHEIARRVAGQIERRKAPEAVVSEADAEWQSDPHVAAAFEVVTARAQGRTVLPDANLELDLGFDSMERVELLTELEQRFRVRVDPEVAHELFTVRQVIEAVRPAGDGQALAIPQESWAALLEDLPPEGDPVLSGLLEPRSFAAPALFAASRLLRWLLVGVETTGGEHLPSEGPYIISPNHQGYLDPFLICSVLPYRVFRNLFFVGAAEYFETPVTRWLARECNVVPVDPDANLVPAMKAGAFGLAHGKILMLFPEGERSIDGAVKRFKKGAPILSQHLEVPIVPVAIAGAYELWPRNRPINWRAFLPFSRHRVRVAFGTPVRFDGATSYADSANLLRERVVRLWERLSGGAAI